MFAKTPGVLLNPTFRTPIDVLNRIWVSMIQPTGGAGRRWIGLPTFNKSNPVPAWQGGISAQMVTLINRIVLDIGFRIIGRIRWIGLGYEANLSRFSRISPEHF